MKPIFHDSYPANFLDIVNQHNFAILEALAGSDSTKVACLAPDGGSNYRDLERRKAVWVQLLINALSSGVSLDAVPDGCSCDELAYSCQALVLEAVGVESQLVDVTAVTTTTSSDITFLSGDGAIDTTILAAGVPGTHALGTMRSNELQINLPDAGPNSLGTLSISALSVNGVALDSAMPAIPFADLDVAPYGKKAFLPGISGITAIEITIPIAAI